MCSESVFHSLIQIFNIDDASHDGFIWKMEFKKESPYPAMKEVGVAFFY